MEHGNEQKVRAIIARIMQVDAALIGDNASPSTIATWDSLRHMKLVLAVEEEFGVTFDEEQIIQMISFPKILSILGELSGSL